jgi:hypothetical protein
MKDSNKNSINEEIAETRAERKFYEKIKEARENNDDLDDNGQGKRVMTAMSFARSSNILSNSSSNKYGLPTPQTKQQDEDDPFEAYMNQIN